MKNLIRTCIYKYYFFIHVKTFFIFFLFFCFSCLRINAQKSDTVYNGSKVILVSNIVTIHDTSDFKFQLKEHPVIDTGKIIEPKTMISTTRVNNDCGVKAAFDPAGDTIITSSFFQPFTNKSVNATSFNWIINGILYLYNSGPTINLTFSVGVNEIKLVARNGTCTDTAVAYYFNSGIAPENRKNVTGRYGLPSVTDIPTTIAGLESGGFLLGGYTYNKNKAQETSGLLIKVKDSGCVEWTKIIEATNSGTITRILTLKDGGFIISGTTSSQNLYLLKFDADGNVKWQKSYSIASYSLRSLYELNDGSIIFANYNTNFTGFHVIKVDANGALLWNKQFQLNLHDFATPDGITEIEGNIFISGSIRVPNNEAQYNSEYNRDGFIVSINSSTGKTNWSKSYGAINSSDFFQDIHNYNNGLLVSGIRTNYLGGSNALQTFHFIDVEGNISGSHKVYNSQFMTTPFTAKIIPLQEGKFYLAQTAYQPLSLQPGYQNHSNFLKLDASLNILWQNSFSNYFRHKYPYTTKGTNESLASLGSASGDLLINLQKSSEDFLFTKMDSSGRNDMECSYWSTSLSILPDEIFKNDIIWQSETSFQCEITESVLKVNTAYAQVRYLCPEYIDSCSYLILDGTRTLCNISNSYTYRVRKNKTCFQAVQWDFSKGVQVISKNDSIAVVRFPSFGTYQVSALLANSCTPVKDSLVVVASPNHTPIDLGRDTILCAGTNITLRASSNFVSYQWQDLSTDSIFIVTSPGKYWVTVKDSCNNILSDTINIEASTTININAGPDRVKCNNDTLHFKAQDGFINYTWSNHVNTNVASTQSFIDNPSIDAWYFLKAEKTPGCFAYDTVFVSIYHSIPISLGADTIVCFDEHVVLDAGPGFNQYNWSNGSILQSVKVNSSGSFSVIGTTEYGCKSYDTVVVKVNANPVVQLNKETTLCKGTIRTLDAGNFTSYLWNDGTTSRTLNINDVGKYSVVVTDNYGCKGKDSTEIKNLFPIPSAFLPTDISICSFGSVSLKPNSFYNQYLWSNNSSSNSITVTQPGLYWLQVTDKNNCIGRDSILIKSKECLEGFYIPSAFTPNSDGKNDIFQPLIFGDLKQYVFTIYNRYGQIIFSTTEQGKGWDGNHKGQLQGNHVFIWTCTYQLNGQSMKYEKGTVMVIR